MDHLEVMTNLHDAQQEANVAVAWYAWSKELRFRKLVKLVLIFINHVEEAEFPHNCAKSYLKAWARFLSTVI